MSLVIAAGVLLRPADQPGQAAGSWYTTPPGQSRFRKGPQSTVATAQPEPTPTFPPLLTPTSLPIPHTGLVWVRNANGAYLWEAPQGKILTRLRNGTQVHFLEERSSYGNLPWLKVQTASGPGWMLLTQVFREGRSPVAYIAIPTGTYLREQPRGGIRQALPMGTPIMNRLGAQQIEGRAWAQVQILDGTVGWVAEEWLCADAPAGDSGN